MGASLERQTLYGDYVRMKALHQATDMHLARAYQTKHSAQESQRLCL